MSRTKKAIKEMGAKWPSATRILIEDKANGPAVLSELQHDVQGLIAINPEGGKLSRAQAVSAQVESGNCYLPHPCHCPWTESFVEELASFPFGKNDDMVDACTQLLNYLRQHSFQLGLIDYMRQEEARLNGLQAARQLPVSCPTCGGSAIVKIVGNYRCNSCGWQKAVSAVVHAASTRGHY